MAIWDLARPGLVLRCQSPVDLFSSFPLLLAFVVGGLGFEFCVFVTGWRHALRSEWPFIIIIKVLWNKGDNPLIVLQYIQIFNFT